MSCRLNRRETRKPVSFHKQADFILFLSQYGWDLTRTEANDLTV